MTTAVTDTKKEPQEELRGSTRAIRVYDYEPDSIDTVGTTVRMLVYPLVGGALTLAAWYLLRASSLAAFNVSMVPRALATACSFVVILAVGALLLAWLRDESTSRRRPTWRVWLTEFVCSFAPAGLVVSTLGIPLASTKLYLDGIQVDQGFRTQFLTRMADTMSNQDMNYADLPAFYPIGWFWLGGRLSDVLGMPGWEVYQPWALVSLATAASQLVPLWRKLTSSLPIATAIALVTIAIILTQTPDEPYAAIVGMFVPAAAVLGYYAMRGSWAPTITLTLYLGLSACLYTLYTGIVAVTMMAFALTGFLTMEGKQRWVPLRQLALMGFGSILIALIAWGPYLMAVLRSPETTRSTAQHFLPSEGAEVPLPFFDLSLVGLLSLAGLVFLVVRFRRPEIAHISIAVGVCYVWVVGSMVITLAGTTLLGFRVEVLVALLLSTAGILAIADLRLSGLAVLYPNSISKRCSHLLTTLFVLLLATATLGYVQQIPAENESFIDEAYASTDGNGERSDLRESDVGRYYKQMDEYIQSRGYTPGETVLFTDEINFMAYHPYRGFNAFTSHYANPLGEFDARNESLKQWANGSFNELSNPQAFAAAIDDAPWAPPQAFIFRGSETDPEAPWKTHIAHDIFPSQPNVHYEALFFNPAAFNSPEWDTQQFGPFVVVVRNR